MTDPQSLYDRHKDRPWWPKGLIYDWNFWGPKTTKRWFITVNIRISDELADALILGSAVKWLVERESHAGLSRLMDVYCANDGSADTLTAAVLAACEAVEEGR